MGFTALLLLAWTTAHAGVVGYRHGGDGAVAAPLPPIDQPVWRTPMPSWSNGTPLVVGPLVCTTSEPLTVLCLHASDGSIAWRDDLSPLDGMDAETAAVWSDKLALASSAAERLSTKRREVSEARRRLRAGDPDGQAAARLSTLAAELSEINAALEEVGAVAGTADWGIIGFSTPSLASDGGRIYAQFGNGLVAAWSLDGRRAWTRWLGPPPACCRGYDYGRSASPILADGVLVVAHDRLRGLDPATGDDRWTGSFAWEDYGTPGVVDVDGLVVVTTPQGYLVRASDGETLAKGVANRMYLAPLAVGHTLYGVGEAATRGGSVPRVSRWDLARDGDGVVATKRWSHDVHELPNVYAAPSWTGTHVVFAPADGPLWRVTPDGDVTTWARLPFRPGYPSKVWTDDGLLASGDDGFATVVKPDGTTTDVVTWGAHRASPVVAGERVYVRTLEALSAWGVR